MKYIYSILASIAGLLVLAIVAIWIIKTRVGDIRPIIFSPDKISQVPEAIPSAIRNGGEMPFPLKVPQGYHIGLFAHDLGAVRDLQISPEGILVASVTSGGKVLAFTDENSDGIADETHLLLSNIRKPHGLAFYKGYLYVASELAVTRYKWNASKREAVFDKTLFDIPAGGRHFTRSITFNSKGVMFVSIGSTCDTCNENHPWYAAVITSDMNGKSPLLYASGLRNSPFIITRPETDQIWGTEMGRDFLGDDTPPDEINIINGGNYGWPICYGDRKRDRAYAKNMPDSKCANTKSPVYEIPSHSAPLGLTFIPAEWESMKGNLLVGYHGSWNRSVPAGYKVVYLSVNKDGVSNGADFITGFIKGSAAYGRPVDVEFDKHGDLFVSDDKAGNIYIVTKQ